MHASTYILQITTCISLPYVLHYEPSTEMDVGTRRVVAEGQGKIALGDAMNVKRGCRSQQDFGDLSQLVFC